MIWLKSKNQKKRKRLSQSRRNRPAQIVGITHRNRTMLIWNGDKVLDRIERQSGDIKRRTATAIADRARFLCPVKTGNLRSKIKAGPDSVEVNADYAGAVELGTAKRAAQPFVRPAIEQVKETDIL